MPPSRSTPTSQAFFVPAGYRDSGNGSLSGAGGYGSYWSSTVDCSGSRSLNFYSGSAFMSNIDRAFGFSIRCLKD